MELILALGIGVMVASGVWLILRPRTFQVIIGLSLIAYAVNLFIFAMGRLRVGAPPALTSTEAIDAAQYTDPVPQALVLTAIVIGFGLLAFLLVLAHRVHAIAGTDDVDDVGRER